MTPPGGPFVLITVTLPKGGALQDAMRRYELAPEEVDEAYGLVSVNPAQGLYAMMVSAGAAARITGRAGAKGPYANPEIEPFGPPEPGPEGSGDQI
ncbi:hypothetical protein [Streptomyces lomondensis]|uniref:Uncharacterized protein n=1 Tax=Streptomyces lomondensis TaxID=68229 RepID=A0ABQ2XX12_9ACTN|nr:hypothetical protein [Streptomyces lomondensis]MCF0082768.1 hypothetical protein [Streptomyces lomondensis]GGX36562.1 hypothetical protein GCM10010383_78370 [Streptomyces lomondensis]